MAIRGEPAGGRDQSRHNLVSGRSEDPNDDAVMRIGSEAPKRRTHSSNRHESQGALPGFRHLEPSSAFHHKRTDKAETVGRPLQHPPFIGLNAKRRRPAQRLAARAATGRSIHNIAGRLPHLCAKSRHFDEAAKHYGWPPSAGVVPEFAWRHVGDAAERTRETCL